VRASRARASIGVTVVDRGRQPPVLVVASEAAHAFEIARDFDQIAADLEAEERS
jgi:hypothetical protein